MKRILSIFISLAFLFMCACSNQNADSETTTAATNEQTMLESQTTENAVEYVTEWDSELVPDNFPAPPEKTHDVAAAKGKANNNYHSDWVRLRFTCPEPSFYVFSNKMAENGYIGGAKNISNGTYYTNGFKGYWQDGENYVRIYKSEISENNEIAFTLDILECRDNFPDELTEYFPKFEGFTKAQGVYCGHDSEGKHETYEFNGTFDSPSWHWDFRFTDGFVGVEEAEFEAYYNLLGEEGFNGIISTSMVDGCSTISVDTIKEINGKSYCVFLLYNQTLKTLDIAYTNDPTIYEH